MEEAKVRWIATEETKEMKRLEKLEKEKWNKLQVEEWVASKREREYWKKVMRNGWGDKFHDFIKFNNNQAATPGRILYNLVVLHVCMYNQRITMLRVKFKKEKIHSWLLHPRL